MNKVILIGRIGKTPETKTFDANYVTKIALATSRTFKDKNGEKKQDTQWHNVVIWNNKLAAEYLHKGGLIAVEGEITYRSYEKDGNKCFMTEIKAFNLESLSGKKEPEKKEPSEHGGDDLPF